jgi:hypothetical protein
VTTAAGAHDQPLVAYYAASVFMSFLVGLLTMDRLARRERRHKPFVMNLIGAIIIVFTLIANLAAERRGIASTRATEHHD